MGNLKEEVIPMSKDFPQHKEQPRYGYRVGGR